MESSNRNATRRPHIKNRQRGTIKFKTRLVVAAASVFFLVVGSIIFFNIGIQQQSNAAVSGDYRTLASGNWNGLATWEKYNGTVWLPTATAPTSADGVISIQTGHTVNIIATVSVDQVVIESGAIVNITAGTLTVANGTGTDLNVSGTFNQNTGGTVTVSASALVNISNGGTYNHNGGTHTITGWAVNNGGTYVHNVNGINIPTATWGATSTLKITGVTTSDLNGLTQSFGNFIYNCPSQTAVVEFRDNLLTVQGDFTVNSTGSSSIFLQRISTATPMTIGGNFLQSAGTVYGTKGAVFTMDIMGSFTLNNGTFIEVERYGMPVMNIYGVFTINAGTFSHSTYSAALPSEGIGTVNLFNNYVRNGGLHTETSTGTGRGDFNFAKSGTQTFSYTGGSITNTVNFTVNNGSVLDLANYAITGGGFFTLSSGGGLIMASSSGITSAGATGNVQVTGIRTYSTGGDYTYNGTTAQVTGNGLPTTVRNITFDNSNNVTLSGSSSATGVITLTSGKVITGGNILGSTNTATTSIVSYSSTNYVVGNLRRSVAATGAYDFPLGTMANYELANVNFAGMTGVSDLLTSFVNENPLNPSYPIDGLTINNTPVDDILNYGYWAITPDNIMSGGNYSITLNEKGHTNSAGDPHYYGVIKRKDGSSFWQSQGTHTNDTQSESGGVAIASRSALTAFSHFAIGKGTGPLPVNLISFSASVASNTVKCFWQTSSEVNNDFFTLERSRNGTNFTEVDRIEGAGYSSNPHSYTYIDKHPYDGISYYRLKQTDYDGKTEYFQIIKVNTVSKNENKGVVRVTPNPIQSDFIIQFDSDISGEATVMINSINGTRVYSEKVLFEEGSNSFNMTMPSNVSSGTYIVRVINDALELPPIKILKK